MNNTKKTHHIICHYAEIGLKGKNRNFFEKKLADNIKRTIERLGFNINITMASGSVIVDLKNVSNEDQNVIKKHLSLIPGIHHFSFAISVDPDIETLKEESFNLLNSEDFGSFKIDTKRSDKSYPMGSMDVSKEVGAFVFNELNKEVKMDNPDVILFIEIIREKRGETRAFIFKEKVKGIGGLPVGSSSKALSLMSGGIDSPVASFLTMKRGVKNEFIHFHSYPFTGKESINKVKDIIKIINRVQFDSIIHWVPFAEAQKEIITSVPAPLRIVMYRRFMMRISSKIAHKKNIPALITGDSIGQVGSQTLENILAVSQVTNLPILRPLSGMDKEEIIDIAKNIDTFDISIRPCEDTCSRFMPDNPTTKADLDNIRSAEEKLDIDRIVEECISQIETERIQEVRKDL